MAINMIDQPTINESHKSTIISTEQQPINQPIQLKYRGQSYTHTPPEKNSQTQNLDGQFRGTKMKITLPVQTPSISSARIMVYRGIHL